MLKIIPTLGVFCFLAATSVWAGERWTGPWNVPALQAAPAFETAGLQNGALNLYFANEPFRGQSTRVFARYAIPANASAAAPVPALVLLHDAGEGASSEWAVYWAERGYAALAIDLFGNGPAGHLQDGGPASNFSPQPDPETDWILSLTNAPLTDMWTYHAVAAAVRGVSLLASFPEVDRARIGVHGIGLGGYLTCIVAGLDDRLAAAAPVYGCGLVQENSAWKDDFPALPCGDRRLWVDNFDPARYLPQATCPISFVTGTNDPDFPLDAFQRSWDVIQAPKHLAVLPGLVHGPIWQITGAANAANLFLDQILTDAPALPTVHIVSRTDRQVRARYESSSPLQYAYLAYTFDTGRWQDRVWDDVPVTINADQTIEAEIPEGPTVTWFLYLADERYAWASSPVDTYFLPDSPPYVALLGLTRPAGGPWQISGQKPTDAAIVIEATSDFCAWSPVAEDRSSGNTFTVDLPESLFGNTSINFRARRLDF